jgi:2-oxoglutarate ferredoxin oxidoreductase subunit beta
MHAIKTLADTQNRGEVLTGILYVAPGDDNLITSLNLVDQPLATLSQDQVRPSRQALEAAMEELR